MRERARGRSRAAVGTHILRGPYGKVTWLLLVAWGYVATLFENKCLLSLSLSLSSDETTQFTTYLRRRRKVNVQKNELVCKLSGLVSMLFFSKFHKQL
jgi:hypothetical protein